MRFTLRFASIPQSNPSAVEGRAAPFRLLVTSPRCAGNAGASWSRDWRPPWAIYWPDASATKPETAGDPPNSNREAREWLPYPICP